MRCLYCGKELALLKRWTGGGEFCSDAHRQQYQEEYNQLALTRLLQAKPQPNAETAGGEPLKAAQAKGAEAKAADLKRPDQKADPKTKDPKPALLEPAASYKELAKEPTGEPARAAAKTLLPAPESVPVAAAAARLPEPEPEPEPMDQPEAEEEAPPAELAGLFIELPVPVDSEMHPVMAGFAGLRLSLAPAFPTNGTKSAETIPALAGHLAMPPAGNGVQLSPKSVDRRLELREGVRTSPVAQLDAQFVRAISADSGLADTSEDYMDILIYPKAPEPTPPLWGEDARSFTFGYELGSLARVAFGTTGIENDGEGLDAVPVKPGPEQLIGVVSAELPRPENANTQAKAEVRSSQPERTPAPVVAVRVPQPALPKVSLAPPAEAAKPAVEKQPEPALVTKPLPVTLHGLAAGRGKPVQVFPSAVTGDLEIQAPRSNALPLRPVMTLGPATVAAPKTPERKPADRTVLVKTDPKKSQPVRPDTRGGNGPVRVPVPEQPAAPAEVEAKNIEAKKEVPKEVTAAVRKDAVKEIPRTAAQEPAAELRKPEPKLEPKKSEPITPKLPEPVAKPIESIDLNLPKLTVPSDGVSMPARIGIAAAAVLIVAIGGYFVLHGPSSTAAAKGPQVVVGSPLPALDSGWITDWGAEAGVRREHEISVLRPSVTLSDYRIEFQAQIETKALGWVFRAKDGKNYYVSKLEIVTPGLDPIIAVVHFAVIDGQAQTRVQSPLPMKVRLDTLYKVRFDALGDHFTTWVQDQKVDDWTDDRLKMGGAGLYGERGERMSLKDGFSVLPLVIKR
jgi:hypothetical protein